MTAAIKSPIITMKMAKPKQCAHCQKPATIHLTQIVGGEIRKVDLCEDCQLKDEVTADFDLEPFAKLAENVVAAHHDSQGESHSCPRCGWNDARLRKTGRFGCPECYDAFGRLLPDLLRKVQPAMAHEGKAPREGNRRRSVSGRRTELRRELESAIREERFEEAAGFRDELRRLDEKGADEVED